MFSKNQITFHLPIVFDAKILDQILIHELGVHYRRNVNHLKNFGPLPKTLTTPQRKTEEGLAQYMTDKLSQNRYSFYLACLKYLLVDLAQKSSFSEVYAFAMKHLQNEKRAFNSTLRVKRGLTDTAQPGGYTKDLVYLEGYVEIENWVAQNGFDEEKLFQGKLSLEEIDHAQSK